MNDMADMNVLNLRNSAAILIFGGVPRAYRLLAVVYCLI